MARRLVPLLLALLAVALPLAGLLTDPLLGWSGVARGEFENWAWLDWWLPRYTACVTAGGGLFERAWAVLCVPRDLDIGNYLDGLLITQPLKALLGPVVGHDARAAVILALNAAAALFACREAAGMARPGRDCDRAALVCALAIACNPVTLWDVAESRFAQALIAPSLAYLGCLLRWARRPGWRTAAWAGAWLAITGMEYWYEAVFLAPVALLSVAWAPTAWRSWAAHLALAAALAAPMALPFVGTDTPHPPPGTPFPALDTLVIPAFGVLGPPGPGLVVAQSIDLARPLAPPLGPSLPFAWVVMAGLSLGAWRDRRWCAAVLAGAALSWWLFALGPHVRHEGSFIAAGWVHRLTWQAVPFMWRLNWPARTLPLVSTALVLLVVPALAAWIERARRGGAALSVGLAVLALAPAWTQGLLPLPTSPLTVPAAYRTAALGPEPAGLVELSLPVNSGAVGWYQSWHGHPVLGGMAFCPPRYSDWPPPWARDPAAVERDALMQWARAPGTSPFPTEALRRVREAGFSWLVVQRSYGGRPLPGSDELAAALTANLGAADVASPEMLAWKLR